MQTYPTFHLGQSSPWLNEILFGICPIENINELSAYYLTKERSETISLEISKKNIIDTIPKNPIKVIVQDPDPSTPSIKPILPVAPESTKTPITEPKKGMDTKVEWYGPNQQDALFWCIFVFQYGIGEYIQIQKYANRRLEENKNIGDVFKKNPKKMKTGNHPVTNGLIQEVISDCFTTKDTTSPIQLIAMAIYYNIRIILMKADGKSYLEFHAENYEKTCVVYEYIKPNKRMSYRINMTDPHMGETVCAIFDGLYKWNTWNQPLRGQSAYKLPELADIAKCLKIDPIGLKKGDLYQRIVESFQETR